MNPPANDGQLKQCATCGAKWFGAVDKCPHHREPMTDDERVEYERQRAEGAQSMKENRFRAQAIWNAAAFQARGMIAVLDTLDGQDDGRVIPKVSGIQHQFEEALRLRSAGAQSLFEDFAARSHLQEAIKRWSDRCTARAAAARAAELERQALARLQWRRVTVDGVDITEQIASMFDAICQSTDWGSGFLDTEEIENIIIVANLVGFDIPSPDPTSAPTELLEGRTQADVFDSGQRESIRDRWLAQVAAKAREMRGDAP